MASLSRSKAVLELGKRLVAQLDDRGDLLSTWMAHMVAERIHAAETAPPERKTAAEEDCAKTILELWNRREALHPGARPLRELEPILRTLRSLDVEEDSYRYYPHVLSAAEEAELSEDVRQWLVLAIETDYAARLLIQFALRSAASAAAEEAAPWIEMARAAGAEKSPEGLIVDLVFGNSEKPQENPLLASAKRKLSRLETFIRSAEDLAEEIRTLLRTAEGGKPVVDDA
jgi:hypothetical protein